MAGLFAQWQPQYAERGIATFPVRDKRPAVSNYLRMGLPASRDMVAKFGDADGFGFACGKRSGVTVVDVDSPNDNDLADALDRYGQTPLIIRSGSGNFQAWFRHNGEGRSIRPDKSKPVDILGGGYVVAPPSRTPRGSYGLISGSLDDLAALPCIRSSKPSPPVQATVPAAEHGEKTECGKRNDTLWRLCMVAAPEVGSCEELIGIAMRLNQERFSEPLAHEEVARCALSAWQKEQDGENFFGGSSGVVIPNEQVEALLAANTDALVLFTILKLRHWKPRRSFFCANAMCATMPPNGWTRQRFAAARATLERLGLIVIERPAIKGVGPAIYRFGVSRIGHQ